MLRHQSQFKGYAIHASDGAIGTVSDLLFNDTTWLVRWLVVDTGNWLPGRKVLLPPSALEHVDQFGRQFSVRLTKQQVKDCPDVETDRPVSRQSETSLYDYYGWSPYWGADSYLGVAGFGGGMIGASTVAMPSPELMRRERELEEAQREKDDPALRSIEEVTGYHVHASDGEIGHVADFLVQDDDWSIHYLVVDTKNWWPGKKVLISPMSVRTIEWDNRLVNLGADRQKIRNSPAYDPSMTIDPIYEKNYRNYYGDPLLREIALANSTAGLP
jgi:sporulation protein YlmC with PRC-barrel domain